MVSYHRAPEPQTDDWTRHMAELINSAKSVKDISLAAESLYNYRSFMGVWRLSAPMLKQKGWSIGIDPSDVVALSMGDPDGIVSDHFTKFSTIEGVASAAFRAQIFEQKVVIVSEDRRLWQSLGRNTTMVSGGSYINAEWLKANHRIKPRQVVDWLMLTDAGISEEKSSEYLQAYGDVIACSAANLGEDQEKFDGMYSNYLSGRDDYYIEKSLPVIWLHNDGT